MPTPRDMAGISVDSPDLRAALLIASRASKESAKRIREATRQFEGPWQSKLLAQAPRGGQFRPIAASGRITTTRRGVVLKVGGSGFLRDRRHRVPLREVVRAFEFGTANRDEFVKYVIRRKGKISRVNRRTKRQLPVHDRRGHMVYPAAAVIIPDIASAWVGAVVAEYRRAGW